MEERLQQQRRRRSWSDRVRLVASKGMNELKQVRLEKEEQNSHAYSALPGRDGIGMSWPGDVQAVSNLRLVGQFLVTCAPYATQAPAASRLA
jgi:hypothetical protein